MKVSISCFPHVISFLIIVEVKGEENVLTYATSPLLFGRWSYEGVECKDISLLAYLNVKTIKA
jgi:hypothetical protein